MTAKNFPQGNGDASKEPTEILVNGGVIVTQDQRLNVIANGQHIASYFVPLSQGFCSCTRIILKPDSVYDPFVKYVITLRNGFITEYSMNRLKELGYVLSCVQAYSNLVIFEFLSEKIP